ncbi:MAG: hypothetical protein IJE68_01730 [Clostridia bacterium]|nr:hypothetical protein [Clostridia bacterium]
MENATKALLIAAAVLVAILIISLGIGIFNTASEQAEGAGDLTQYQIQTFNDKFRKYEGDSRSGADVNALLQTVFSHNNAQEGTDTCVEVKNGDTVLIDDINTLSKSPAKVSTNYRYTVELTYNTTTKLVESILISQNP